MNSYYTICRKIVWFYMNSYKNQWIGTFQFVYKLKCTNWVVQIVLCEFIIKKKRNNNSPGISTHALITSKPTYYQLAVLLTKSLSYFIIYDHIEILHKKTIRKMRLYKFNGVTYSHPLKGVLFMDFVVPHATGRKNCSRAVLPRGSNSRYDTYVDFASSWEFTWTMASEIGKLCTAAAMVPTPRLQGVETSANMSYNKAASLKLEHIIIYIT